MVEETFPTNRIKPTSTDVTRSGKDRLRAVRKTNAKAASVTTHTVVGQMDFCVIKNVSDVNININFKNDDMTLNYWTLKPDETSPVFGVSADTDINYQSVSGNGKELQIILWA